MRIGVPQEAAPERRVALTPDAVGQLVAGGLQVVVEQGAGDGAALPDDDYREAGAEVADAGTVAAAEVIVRVGRITPAEAAAMRRGQVLVGWVGPLVNPDLVQALAVAGVTAFGMESVPRVTRAQRMDALSSQATVSGYKAVLIAADHLPKFFPLLMTAAGTVAPARVLVLGAGVAGLQAIATARRLGAVVSSFDTRPVVKEQVQSLGATFVELPLDVDEAQDSRGYATVLSESQQEQQQRLLEEHIAASDVVVTTALVPGRPAPRLIPADAVQAMRTGSVIVDLAAETGGNCELSEPGESIVRYDVKILAPLNVPSTMAEHASQLYARNIQSLLGLMIADGELNLDFSDEVIAGACITRGGEIVNEGAKAAAGAVTT